jgi:hypothetical protein
VPFFFGLLSTDYITLRSDEFKQCEFFDRYGAQPDIEAHPERVQEPEAPANQAAGRRIHCRCDPRDDAFESVLHINRFPCRAARITSTGFGFELPAAFPTAILSMRTVDFRRTEIIAAQNKFRKETGARIFGEISGPYNSGTSSSSMP